MQPRPDWFRGIAAAFYLTWSAVAIFGALIAIQREPGPITVVPIIVSYACLFLLIIVGGPAMLVMDRRLRRGVIAAELRPCRRCGHSLVGLGRYARCPECGTAHDTVKLRDYWSRRLHVQRRRAIAELIWTLSPAAIAWLILVAFGLFLTVLGAREFGKPLIPLVIILPALLITPLQSYFRLGLIKARFKLCRRCGKRLNGSRPRGKCPLCRLPYELREVQQQWRDDFPADWNRDVILTSERAERILS